MNDKPLTRREALASIAAAGTVLVAGCAFGRSDIARADPAVPDVEFRYVQSKGIYDKMNAGDLEWRSISIEIYHAGGDPVDPSRLGVEVISNAGTDEFEEVRSTLADHDVYGWQPIVGEEQSFENIEGNFEEGDYVIIRGRDHNRANASQGQPRHGDVIRILWTHPDGTETVEIGRYEVQACLDGASPDPDTGRCPQSPT